MDGEWPIRYTDVFVEENILDFGMESCLHRDFAADFST